MQSWFFQILHPVCIFAAGWSEAYSGNQTLQKDWWFFQKGCYHKRYCAALLWWLWYLDCKHLWLPSWSADSRKINNVNSCCGDVKLMWWSSLVVLRNLWFNRPYHRGSRYGIITPSKQQLPLRTPPIHYWLNRHSWGEIPSSKVCTFWRKNVHFTWLLTWASRWCSASC